MTTVLTAVLLSSMGIVYQENLKISLKNQTKLTMSFYPYTDYTNYTDYTPYTRYTINPGKTTGNRIPAWMIRKIHKRTRPMMQAQPCIHYDVPGSARKALASAIGEIIGTYPSYQAAPSFAYIIGEYTLDRNGVLTGPRNSQLMLTLDQDGYRTK